jgi:conjugal transfer pilus assembly protein TraB
MITMNSISKLNLQKHYDRIKQIMNNSPIKFGIGAILILVIINAFSVSKNENHRIIENSKEINFQNGRILNDRETTFYHGQERLLSQKAQNMIESQKLLESRIGELEKKLASQQQVSSSAIPNEIAPSVPGAPNLQMYPPTQEFQGQKVASDQNDSSKLSTNVTAVGTGTQKSPPKLLSGSVKPGKDMISFPVKADSKIPGVVLPSGSYVKAKMLTGVDVPEGKTYPVLMVLDFSYVGPNEHKVDLKGCFMIAKAEGDLSTERVQMQATKMSCVSKNGKMFERIVNGFVADEKDGSFAMSGKIQSRQGRVASMAFLSSIVEGVGKAVQAAQTTQSTNAVGGSQSVVTGDTEKYLVAGGASNAAGMVAQWYLRQAQNLAPTVSVDSGRDVWIIMKDKVNLPEEYFKTERTNGDEGIYSYFGRTRE